MATISMAAARTDTRAGHRRPRCRSLRRCRRCRGAFANGTHKKSVQVADGQTVQIGVPASDVGTSLMQALKDIATFDAGAERQFHRQHQPDPGAEQLPDQRDRRRRAASRTNLNTATAANGYVYNQLQRRPDQQTSLTTLYKGFISNIQDTNMADGGHPAIHEPDRAAGGAAGHRAAEPDFAAELPAGPAIGG